MGFFYFAINGQRCSQILHLITRIFLQLKLLAVHFNLLKPSPEHHADSPFHRPTSYVFLTDGPCPSLLTVPATDLQARIKNSLPIVQFGDFVQKQGIENEEDGQNWRCAICLCQMERSEKMRELANCCHVFHRDCLDTWIDELQITCPVCRSMLFPAAAGDGFRFFR